MVKLKEEFDYKSLSRRLDIELDKLIVEHERQQKAFEDEVERLATEAQQRISDAERNYVDLMEVGSISSLYISVTRIAVCMKHFLKHGLTNYGVSGTVNP